MSHRIDRSGQQFNDWTVLRYVSGKFYLCRCKCGTEKAINKDNLLRGNSRSCRPCAGRKVAAQWKLPEGQAAFNDLVHSYKQGAKARGIKWDLTTEQVKQMFAMPCLYCGDRPSAVRVVPACNGSFTYSGIDRLDSSQSYTEANCVPCCKKCNYMKASLSVDEFRSHILKLASRSWVSG